ncbi:hypothetical protein RQP46_007140 [Phenoliferia psychrophenolica]
MQRFGTASFIDGDSIILCTANGWPQARSGSLLPCEPEAARAFASFLLTPTHSFPFHPPFPFSPPSSHLLRHRPAIHVAAVVLSALTLSQSFLSASASHKTKVEKFKGWKNYKANGVNLGAWLELEKTFAGGVIPDAYDDEWTYCEAVGKAVCSVVLEKHYATYVTTADIDKIARYGVNTVRIATSYAVWIDLPDSWLYHGSQLKHLRTVAEYQWLGDRGGRWTHELVEQRELRPERFGRAKRRYLMLDAPPQATHFAESMQVVGKVLDYIEASPNSGSYTFSPINEPGDDFSTLFTSYPSGTEWLLKYMRAVYAMIKSRKMSTPLLHTDTYHDNGPSYWASYWPKGSNIVMDTHIYYYVPTGISAAELPLLACEKAKQNSTSTFPVLVGEFTVAATDNNTLAFRPETQLYAFQKYLNGGVFWNARYLSNDTIGSGEGYMSDYWSYESLIDAGAINPGGALTKVVKGC